MLTAFVLLNLLMKAISCAMLLSAWFFLVCMVLFFDWTNDPGAYLCSMPPEYQQVLIQDFGEGGQTQNLKVQTWKTFLAAKRHAFWIQILSVGSGRETSASLHLWRIRPTNENKNRDFALQFTPEAQSTQDAWGDAKGPVDVNGSVHTARKQHQRKNVPICMRVALRRASCVDWAWALQVDKCERISFADKSVVNEPPASAEKTTKELTSHSRPIHTKNELADPNEYQFLADFPGRTLYTICLSNLTKRAKSPIFKMNLNRGLCCQYVRHWKKGKKKQKKLGQTKRGFNYFLLDCVASFCHTFFSTLGNHRTSSRRLGQKRCVFFTKSRKK